MAQARAGRHDRLRRRRAGEFPPLVRAHALRSDAARALIAPLDLHSGLGPDDAGSALIGKLTFAAVVSGGMPVIKGGGGRLVEALARVIENRGGQLLTNAQVDRVLVEGQGRRARAAAGVQLADGRRVRARDAVVCNVTPQQLYGQLLPDAPPPARERAQAYRYGRGCMQLHFALNAPPAWMEPELVKVPLVHLTESLEQVAPRSPRPTTASCPRPTLAIGQPVAVDPSRAPEGGWILWIQMQEMPARLKGDAAGQIDTPADGRWNEAVREVYADRAGPPGTRHARLAERIVGRRASLPADLETLNCNPVGGDPYRASARPTSFWLPLRQRRRARGHRTPVAGLYHIGASTHPGPGLGAGSGTLVAREIARK